MRSGRNIIGIVAAAIGGGWLLTGMLIDASWTDVHGAEITRNLGLPESPMLVSALIWTAIVYFAAINVLLPTTPTSGSIGSELLTLGERLRSRIVADDDDEMDEEYDLRAVAGHDDGDDEPMHPSHWLGARIVALAAVAVTFIVCEGLDMVKPALAVPAHVEILAPAIHPAVGTAL